MASRVNARAATLRLHRPHMAEKVSLAIPPVFTGGILIGGGAVSSTLAASGVLVGGGQLTGSIEVFGV